MRLLASSLLLASTLQGCFALADTDDFVEDEGCDLELGLENFTPHLGQYVEVRLVQERADPTLGAPRLLALALVDPLTTANLTIDIPGAVPPLVDPAQPRPTLDFFADANGDRAYSGQPDDHTWRVEDPCDPERDPGFPHNFTFLDLPATDAPGSAVFVDFCPNLTTGDAIGPLEPLDGTEPIEVRVSGTFPPLVDGLPEETRPLALYRLGSIAQSRMGVRIPDIFDDGFEYRIDIYADVNENFRFDPDVDKGWVYFFAPGDAEECEPLSEVRTCGLSADSVTVVPACRAGRDIRVRLSRSHIANTANVSDVLGTPWLRVPEGT